MFRHRCVLTAALGLLLAAMTPAADAPLVIDLWPGVAPGEKGNIGPEEAGDPKSGVKTPVKSITNVTKPTITVYRPAKDVDTGAAVVVAPGGGYRNLSWENEGTKVAEWLQSIGVTGVVLKYRVPRRPDQSKDLPPVGALQDAQRAISVVRACEGMGRGPEARGHARLFRRRPPHGVDRDQLRQSDVCQRFQLRGGRLPARLRGADLSRRSGRKGPARTAQAGNPHSEGHAALLLSGGLQRRGPVRRVDHPCPGAETSQGAGGTAHLCGRRTRVRDARLGQAVRDVDEAL